MHSRPEMHEARLPFNAAPDSVPAGWRAAETAGKGTPAAWPTVTEPSIPGADKNVVAITENPNRGGTYNLLINEEHEYRDLELEVAVQARDGKEDQGGGLIWRARDANNYYITRWNPLETNLRFYTVKDGKRTQLATVEKIAADPRAWHTLKVRHAGDRIMIWFDGKQMIDHQDGTFTEAGKVGLWVKADGRTAFGGLRVHNLKR